MVYAFVIIKPEFERRNPVELEAELEQSDITTLAEQAVVEQLVEEHRRAGA